MAEVANRFCPACGSKTIPGARYCTSCGAELPNPVDAELANEEQATATASIPDPKVGWADRTFRGGARAAFGCLGMIIALIVLGGVLLRQCAASVDPPKETIAREAAEQVENHRKGFHCLSPIDGSEPDLTRQIKERITDPDSYQHIETRITPVNKGGYHGVFVKFRSRNGFGGMVIGNAWGVVSTKTCDGNLIRVD